MSQQLSILAVTSQAPWPLDRGGHLRTYHLLRALAASHHVRLVAPASGAAEDAVQALADVGIDLRLAPVRPRSPWREAVRVGRAAATGEAYVMYARHRRRAVLRTLEREVRAQAPDLWYLDHLDSCVYAPHDRPFIVDCHNVYSEVARRTGEAARGWLRRRYLAREARLLGAAEQRAAQAAKAIIAVSDRDARYFAGLGARRVYVAPNGVDTSAYATVRRTGAAVEPIILFVGTLAWPPNTAAVLFLAQTVLPQVRSVIPNARLRVIGADAPRGVQALAGLPGVEIAGRVADMRPHLRDAHLLAVPLDAGGGTRLKILEAFAAGLPVVSTAIGAEGLRALPDEHLAVVDRDLFSLAVIDLLQRPERAAGLAARARRLAADEYDWRAIGEVTCRAAEEAARPDRRARMITLPAPIRQGVQEARS
jgi:polysaccharide biosynthesis protein PslH